MFWGAWGIQEEGVFYHPTPLILGDRTSASVQWEGDQEMPSRGAERRRLKFSP